VDIIGTMKDNMCDGVNNGCTKGMNGSKCYCHLNVVPTDMSNFQCIPLFPSLYPCILMFTS
jgi:hypothetical protein